MATKYVYETTAKWNQERFDYDYHRLEAEIEKEKELRATLFECWQASSGQMDNDYWHRELMDSQAIIAKLCKERDVIWKGLARTGGLPF